jgi:LytR cell envelope-related transcriptional attenuator
VTSMAFPRGRGRSPGRNLAATATRGAVLIGLAVIIGLVLLQVVDDSKGGGGGGGSSSPGGVTTTVTTGADGSSTSTTVTTVPANGARPASQVVVEVLNGSGVAGAAASRSNDLKAKGYQVLPAGNAAAQRSGTAVQCRKGYEKEAAALVNVLGSLSIRATVEAFPNPAPVGVNAQANCLVILGR